MTKSKPSPFPIIINQYLESIDALREFSELVEPVLVREQTRRMKKDARNVAPFFIAMNKLGYFQEENMEEEEKLNLEDLFKDIEREYKDKVDFKVVKKGKRKSVKLNFKDHEFEKTYHKAKAGMDRSLSRVKILRQSVLVSVVSNTEWFLSELLFSFFEIHPEPITETTEKAFSYKEIIQFDSFEDIKANFIKSKIRDLLFEGIEGWLDFILKKLKVENKFFVENIDPIKEIFLRRNLIVHNGGKINRIYLENLPEALTKGLKRGGSLSVTEKYIEEKTTLLELAFIILGVSIWQKAIRDEVEFRSSFLTKIVVEKIERENFFFGKMVSHYLLTEEKLDRETEIVAKINYWQCFKWEGNLDSVRDEILKTDFSGIKDRYLLGKFALLDKNKEFFEILPKAIKNNEIRLVELKTWPLFQKIRRTKKYKEFLSAL